MAGKLVVEGCKLSSASLTCISVHHKDTKPKIRRCEIYQCAGTGVHFYDGSEGVVEDTEIHHNGQSGIEISEGSRPEIRFNRIRSNGKHGVAVFDNGRGVITDNDINSNGLSGIDVRESSNPRIVRNKIFGHEHSGGVDVHHHSRCEIEKNDIFQNSLSGITCWQAGKPLCKQNRITQNGEFGILVKDGGWGTFEHNDLRGNSRGSLFVSEDSKNKIVLDNNSVE
ncbi:hypothetical protein GUITHDRAFT_78656 [Guillardia theta CCMP2712]|uniref:Carbohydrate-binding/sugar hydrolysis domain-containing protein n=2 Tax=Guillardia theta TaxID=55529 RepID=L1IL46_GUITC|nr:hypothetical protein GUITHDRAFT_78656 [Guillardia theta CCMP2712]EKX36832.1 hypothetical protein GUITHDRAFT_78656 [Guillardia theta CCMP2712]|eukprot:XP_005823812.1 hypothetical protein GUITHDRAFT_78656 [Guillardia theta CCMP2712]